MFVIASTRCGYHLNSPLLVKRVHSIESLSQAARLHGDFHDVRKVAGNGLRAWPTFVASHVRSTLCVLIQRCTTVEHRRMQRIGRQHGAQLPAFVRYWNNSGHCATALTSHWVRAAALNRLQTRLVRYRIDYKRLDVIFLKCLVGAAGFESTTPSPSDWPAHSKSAARRRRGGRSARTAAFVDTKRRARARRWRACYEGAGMILGLRGWRLV